ncbi:hypothetical protein ACS0TY_034387 [Phlomoides rotata]
MAGREVREYTNLTDPKDKKLGKGKDRVDDEEVTFQRMVAKMQEVAGERGGYLHGRGALDSDDLLYLKEQMEAEEDAERLLRRTEKRAFAAFKISFLYLWELIIYFYLKVVLCGNVAFTYVYLETHVSRYYRLLQNTGAMFVYRFDTEGGSGISLLDLDLDH